MSDKELNQAMWLTGQIFAIIIAVILYFSDVGYAKCITVYFIIAVLVDIRKEVSK